MNTLTQHNIRNQSGSALIAVMGVVLLMALIAAGMVALGRQQVFTAERMRDYVKAQMIAEAGVNDAYNLMKTNFAARLDDANFPLKAFDGGTYDATVTPVGTNKANIAAVGVYRSATCYSKANIENIPLITTNGLPPPTSPWAYGVFCNGYLSFNGSSTFRGSAHINNYFQGNGSVNWGSATNPIYFECSGANGFSINGASTIIGTIRAPDINVHGTVSSAIEGPVPTIAMPIIDLTPYYQTALANGQVFNSSTINNAQNWGTIPGGVRWYNGNLTVNGGGSITYKGCVIATGNMTLRGSTTQTQIANLPAFISRDGSITMNGAHTINGLVYAGGNMTFNGSGSVAGALMAGGNMIFNGAASLVVNYVYSNPSGAQAGSQDHVIITAWMD